MNIHPIRFYYSDEDGMRLRRFHNCEDDERFDTIVLSICGDPMPMERDAMTLWYSEKETESLMNFFTSLNTLSEPVNAFKEGEKVQIDILYIVQESDAGVPEEVMETLSETLAGMMGNYYFAGIEEIGRINTYKVTGHNNELMTKIAITNKVHTEDGEPMTYMV